MKRILRYGKGFVLSEIQILSGHGSALSQVAVERQPNNGVTRSTSTESNKQSYRKSSLLCVQTHAQALALPGRGRANGVLALLLLAVSIGLQASPLTRQEIPSDSLPGRQAGIKPLQIGDAIPDELWDMPLQVVNHPEGEETITLGDYKGKLIILDFWATWCGSCIVAMDALHDVQQQFIDEMALIPVSSSKPHDTDRLLKSHARLQSLNLSSVVDAQSLADLFPHITLPHYAWIDPRGVLVATTGTADITASNITKVLNDEIPTYALKTFIDLEGPLLLEQGKLPSKDIEITNYTLFIKGEMPSLPFTSRLRKNGDQVYGRAFFNQTIGQLYFGIAKELLGEQFSPKRIVFDADTNTYPEIDYRRYREVSATSRLLNTYEFIVPLEMADSLYSLMLANLNAVSGFTGRLVKKEVTCLTLKQLPPGFQRHFPDKHTEIEPITIKKLVKWLEKQPFAIDRIVLDETKTTKPINIVLDTETTLSSYNAQLEEAGLFIEESVKALDFFVLSN
ncbi:TlpA family protein disulfide reductase [Parapedobacter koreensis]|uniref:Thiol-disulfide isomerase or thioredoxin n=1 Tax=Parapedobacter koreensis TaxID=332977 RepID=A0A1H7Q175_9SPHI|nr:TlpA disulfide reductase family protein [Parapedobacter koreensis]SEL41464.1 Thiol-disulfide isomerase or thioredoxin [Parapedobacter koreensis]